MQPGATPEVVKSASTTNSGLAAIITVVNSNHIELRSFAVEAASEAGVLLDQVSVGDGLASDTDIAIEDLVSQPRRFPPLSRLT
jgi:hypothetical protein